jgi:protein-L-isoaspartate(D-aspartate) O-methyltransferase
MRQKQSDGEKEYPPNDKLIDSLKRENIIKSKLVEEALRNIKREDFLWKGEPRYAAYFDEPRALGDTGQTISAPHMVAIMLEEAELQHGLTVLEVGTGSGYNAALIGHIVSRGIAQGSLERPLVISIERDPRLVKFARENLAKTKLDKVVQVIEGDGSLGYPNSSKDMMYDRILVTAAAPFIPPHLEIQLKIGGILLAPVGELPYQTLIKERKTQREDGKVELSRQELMGVMFVPLIGEGAYRK